MAIDRISGNISVLVESAKAEAPDDRIQIIAALGLLEGLLSDVRRIADALDIIAQAHT